MSNDLFDIVAFLPPLQKLKANRWKTPSIPDTINRILLGQVSTMLVAVSCDIM